MRRFAVGCLIVTLLFAAPACAGPDFKGAADRRVQDLCGTIRGYTLETLPRGGGDSLAMMLRNDARIYEMWQSAVEVCIHWDSWIASVE